MDEFEQIDRLWEVAARFGVKRSSYTLLGQAAAPFDISKPNQHDSKGEFLAEEAAVDAINEHCRGLLHQLLGREDESMEAEQARKNLVLLLDDKVRRRNSRTAPDSIITFLRKGASEISASSLIALLLVDMIQELWDRKRELHDQETEFWSGGHRPPNHWARTIALRFARFVARQTGKRPTIGVARDGGHPSTEYGRALEEVFAILGIVANVRNAGRWAISQLTDDDLQPPHNALAGFSAGPGILGNALKMANDSGRFGTTKKDPSE